MICPCNSVGQYIQHSLFFLHIPHKVWKCAFGQRKAHINLIPTTILYGSIVACTNNGSHMRDNMFQGVAPDLLTNINVL